VPHHQWLYLEAGNGTFAEIFNGARTAAYLKSPVAVLPNGYSIGDVLDFGGCPGYAYEPPCDDNDVTPDVGVGAWDPYTFVTPAIDDAPWYRADTPASGDGLGFFIEQWTGLDTRHVARPTSPRGPFSSQLGRLGAAERVMKMNVMVIAASEQGLEHMFRWLEQTLMTTCATCTTSRALIRRWCPDDAAADGWDGVVELRQVGLVEGLEWLDDPMPTAACFVRHLSLALATGDPCMYLPDTDRPAYESDADADVATCLTIEGVGVYDRVNCRPSCTELNATCRTIRTIEADPLGAMAPVVTWTNSGDGYTWPFRARVYHDPHVTNADPNPCGLQILGELYVRTMRPGAKLRWDVTGRTVEYMDHSTGGWVNGWAYIEANDPPNRKFFALPCGTHQLVMEPSSLCGEQNAADIFTLEGITYDPPVFPTVSIKLSERVNCP
jgi:hypothetical protein